MSKFNELDAFTRQYILTALWSSTDQSTQSGGESLDSKYSPTDIAMDSLARMIADCQRFQRENAESLEAFDDSAAGHDFWLTRNHHGAGFWDGEYPEPEAGRLTKAAHAFGECSLYIGDDEQIHFFG